MKKILVIEDNPHNMKMVTLILSKSGYEVRQATYAEQGIILAQDEQPDLILMDIQLPEMSGKEATQILKNDPKTSHIKIVAITAYAVQGDMEKTLNCGCDGYVAKPIRYKEFLKTVEGILQ
ncbi:MAG: response regulator [Fibrobacterales bacterium]